MMNDETLKIAKQDLRKHVISLLRKQKEEDRLKKSLSILKKLFVLPEFKRAKTVLFYASFDGEVDTLEMMKQSLTLGKKIALPNIYTKTREILPTYVDDLQEDLVLGPYGIKQSRHGSLNAVDIDEIDLSIVPGVAFDRNNYRLGRGAGYYDRFLSRLSKHIPSIGLAFDFQMVPCLPRQEHDVPMTKVVSNK
jgi:5-formyltetrahydrofolate cyclo-ligase